MEQQVNTPDREDVTTDPIGKIQELLGASLRKEGNFEHRVVKRMIEKDGELLVTRMKDVFQKRYRYYVLDQQLADWTTVIDERHVVAQVPWGDDSQREIHFFRTRGLRRYNWQRAYQKRNLTPICFEDLERLTIKINDLFRSEYPSITLNLKNDGNWHASFFGPHGYGPVSDIKKMIRSGWWFAGVPI